MKTFAFHYISVTNSLSMDDFTVRTKTGLVKKEFPAANILNYYVFTTKDYQALYITYTSEAGKRKKVQLFSGLGEPGFAEMVREFHAKLPAKSLNHLPEKEAFDALKIANPNKWVPFVVFFILLFTCTALLYPGLRHFFDLGHENVTIEEVTGGEGLFGTRNVTVHGTLVDAGTEETVKYSRSSTTTHSTFVPLVDESWQEGDPVRVVLEFKELSSDAYASVLSETSFTGVIRDVWWEGIEKDKLGFFEKEYGIHFDGEPLLIEVTGKETGNDIYAPIAFTGLAVILLIIVIVVARRRK